MKFQEASIPYRKWYVETPCTQDPFGMGWADMDDDWCLYLMGGEL